MFATRLALMRRLPSYFTTTVRTTAITVCCLCTSHSLQLINRLPDGDVLRTPRLYRALAPHAGDGLDVRLTVSFSFAGWDGHGRPRGSCMNATVELAHGRGLRHHGSRCVRSIFMTVAYTLILRTTRNSNTWHSLRYCTQRTRGGGAGSRQTHFVRCLQARARCRLPAACRLIHQISYLAHSLLHAVIHHWHLPPATVHFSRYSAYSLAYHTCLRDTYRALPTRRIT